jgi:hypothetical protein
MSSVPWLHLFQAVQLRSHECQYLIPQVQHFRHLPGLLEQILLQSQLVMMDVIFSLCILAFDHELFSLFFRSGITGILTHLKKCCHALAPFCSFTPVFPFPPVTGT